MRICKSVLLAVFALMFMIAATAAGAPTLTFKFKTIRVPGALAHDRRRHKQRGRDGRTISAQTWGESTRLSGK